MAGKIRAQKITVTSTAQDVGMLNVSWAEAYNSGSVDVYGRYDNTASTTDYDFIIPAGAAKTWDRGLSNNISLITTSGTTDLLMEYN